MKPKTYGRVINKNSETFIASINSTSIYRMYTYDLHNGNFQKTISTKILNQEYGAVRKLCTFK